MSDRPEDSLALSLYESSYVCACMPGLEKFKIECCGLYAQGWLCAVPALTSTHSSQDIQIRNVKHCGLTELHAALQY